MFFDVQKASMLKRISALILDGIVVMILATGFGLLVSHIINYDAQYEKMNAMYASYENEYGITLDITTEEYEKLAAEEIARYEAVIEVMNEDAALSNQYALIMNMTLVILSLGILFAYLISDFVIPLFLKDGVTVGKKIFGLCLMQSDHTKVSSVVLLVRTALGKFAIETMVPVLFCIMIFFGFIGIVGTVSIGLLLILQLAVLIKTQDNLAIHDLLAKTIVVDAKSQMIFENLQAMEEYKQKIEQKQ